MKKLFASMIALAVTAAAFGAETYQQAMKAGHQNRSKRKYQDAVTAYARAEKLTKNASQKYYASFFQGVALVQGRKYDQGVAAFRKSLKIAPTDKLKGNSQYHIGYYLMAGKKNAEALTEMKKVEPILKGTDPMLVDRANYAMSRIYLALKKNKEAYDVALLASASKDKNIKIQALSSAFDAVYRLRDKAKAKDAVDKMFALAGSLPAEYSLFLVYRQGFSYYYYMMRDYQKALETADKIASNPKFSKERIIYGNYYKAISYAALKKHEQANEQWKKLEKCGHKHFEKIAKNKLKAANKK